MLTVDPDYSGRRRLYRLQRSKCTPAVPLTARFSTEWALGGCEKLADRVILLSPPFRSCSLVCILVLVIRFYRIWDTSNVATPKWKFCLRVCHGYEGQPHRTPTPTLLYPYPVPPRVWRTPALHYLDQRRWGIGAAASVSLPVASWTCAKCLDDEDTTYRRPASRCSPSCPGRLMRAQHPSTHHPGPPRRCSPRPTETFRCRYRSLFDGKHVIS